MITEELGADNSGERIEKPYDPDTIKGLNTSYAPIKPTPPPPPPPTKEKDSNG